MEPINMNFMNICTHHCNSSINNVSYEPDDPIGMFLNRQTFITKSNHIIDSSTSLINHSIISIETPISDNIPINTLQQTDTNNHNTLNSIISRDAAFINKQNKSIFHNFQKHIIHVIKKYVSFVNIRKQNPQIPQLAYCLWKTFIALRSSKKKALGIVLGFSETFDRRQQFINLSNEYPQFCVVLSHHSLEDIVSTQQILRKEICKQLERLDRASLQGQCCVIRFDEFYEYFRIFIEQIRHGPITKRLRKRKNTQQRSIRGEERN